MDPNLLIVIFAVFLLVGMPIGYVLGIVGMFSIILLGTVPLTTVPQMMWTAVDSFPLLALPFFILAGDVMNRSGITKSLVNLSKLLVGRFKGGLAYTVVVSASLFASLSGSATATAAAVGGMLVPEMEKEGYDKDFSAALTSSASILGPIIPPSTAAVILGVSASLSIGGLFIAGIVPGILLALALIFIVRLYAIKHNFPRSELKINREERLEVIKEAIPAVFMPLIILGGILGGIFTATEAAGIACVYGILVGFFYTKTLKINELTTMIIRAGVLTGTINIILATSNVLGWTLAVYQVPQTVAAWFLSISDNPYIILFLVNILLLIVGMFMETVVSIVILTPILFPLVTSLGVDPLHFGVIMLVNLCIGIATPPLGLSLFVMCTVAKTSLQNITKKIFPQLVFAIIILMIVTYVPFLSLGLPKLFNLH